MNYFRKFLFNDIFELFFLIFLILLVRYSFWEPFKVPSESMLPNLLVGDFVFANKYFYSFKLPFIKHIFLTSFFEKGDVVIFINKNGRYVKRIIGLPNDKFVYKNKCIFINDIKIKKEILFCNYLFNKSVSCYLLEYLSPYKEFLIKIKLNEYSSKSFKFFDLIISDFKFFVIGDNRDDSHDSRFFGSILFDEIKGKAFFIWLSFDIWKIDFRWNRILKEIL